MIIIESLQTDIECLSNDDIKILLPIYKILNEHIGQEVTVKFQAPS